MQCYGETRRHLNIRVGRHSGVSPLTGKKSKAKTTTAIKDHILFAITQFSWSSSKFWQVVIQNFTLRSKNTSGRLLLEKAVKELSFYHICRIEDFSFSRNEFFHS